MLYLDTHAVVWLFAGETGRFPPRALELIEANDLLISPVVLLELQYLKEIGRVTIDPGIIFQGLANSIGLAVCSRDFLQIVTAAMTQGWTRDPFDRIIAAQAIVGDGWLLTKDQGILDHCPKACWDNT